jgi:SAM-dependent methyltransferase
MHQSIYREFERICSRRIARGLVLEVGAVPRDASLLNMESLRGATGKIGINLKGPHEYKDFSIVRGNANSMTCFQDGQFDTVLCNAMLEHDRFFWKTVSEIRRVTRPGGLIVIGVPGYREFRALECIESFLGRISWVEKHANFLCTLTFTFRIHDAPGDYYRFSPQAFREVFFEGMKDVEIRSVMFPPRLIGSAIKA